MNLLTASGHDWRDQRHTGRIIVEMVSPTALDGTIGTLGGVALSGCSVDANYFSKSRTSAKVSYVGGGWQRNSAVRIHYLVDEWGYSTVIGTYLVTSDDGSWSDGAWHGELTCQSMLWALTQKKLAAPLVVRKGQTAKSAIQSLLSSDLRKWQDYTGDGGFVLADDKIYESGKTYMDVCADLASAANIRLDVNASGVVTLRTWTLPAYATPTFELSSTDPRGVMHDGVSRSSDYAGLPSEVAISCKYSVEVEKWEGEYYKSDSNGHKKGEKKYKKTNEQRELDGYAKLSSGPRSEGVRGFAVTDYRTLNDDEMPTKTQEEIDRRAGVALTHLPGETETWTVTTQYFPVWEGDVGWLSIPAEDGTGTQRTKVLVRALSLDLGTMQLKLTLQKTDPHNEEVYGIDGPGN